MSSSFPTSCVVCVLTVAAGQQRCYRGSWGAPRPPCWERLGPGQRLWSCFQMFPLMGEKHVGRRSLKRILPNTAGAKTQSGPDSRRAVWVLLAGERLVLWMWFGRGSVSMNYWRISNDGDGQAFVSAPSPPGCGHTADALVQLVWFSDCDVDISVTSSLQLEELLLITVIQTQTHQGLHEASPSCRRFSVLLRAFMSQTGIWLQLLCHKAVIQSADVTSDRPDDAFKEEILNGDEVFHRLCS